MKLSGAAALAAIAAYVPLTQAAYPPTFTNTSSSAGDLLKASMGGMLNNYWPGDGSGQFTGIVWFQNAALGIGLVHADVAAKTSNWESLVENMLDNCAKGDNQGSLFQVGDWLDDVGWWGVLAIEAYAAYGQSGTYLGYAKSIHDTMYQTYTTSCAGGIIWEYSVPQLNTVTNTIFITLASKLWKATGDSTYEASANKVLADWSSWALTNDGAVYDQLSSSCQPIYLRVWTYDSGPILMAYKTLYQMTQNATYLDLGNAVATNAIGYFTSKGIMAELGCGEDKGQTCGQDMQAFKGILAQGLGEWYTITRRYDIQQYLFTQAIANIQNNLSPDSGSYIWGPSWLGPYDSSTANVKSTGSTNNLLAAVVQAADTPAITPTTSATVASSTASSSMMSSSLASAAGGAPMLSSTTALPVAVESATSRSSSARSHQAVQDTSFSLLVVLSTLVLAVPLIIIS